MSGSNNSIYQTIVDKNIHSVEVLGYMPAYLGSSKYGFTRRFHKKVAVSFDSIDKSSKADFNILVQCEPPEIFGAFPRMVKQHQTQFDLILTYNPELLVLPNSQFFVPTGCFVDELSLNKTNQISFIMSSKILTDEHRMRFMILRHLEDSDKIGEFDFLMHRAPPPIENKNNFFVNAKFHITCENSRAHNMFSEKIIDCFRTKTVPIYYGCGNIENFFNCKGIIKFNTIDEFKTICKEIKPSWYTDRLPYIEENYKLSEVYWSKTVYQRIEDIIEQHLS